MTALRGFLTKLNACSFILLILVKCKYGAERKARLCLGESANLINQGDSYMYGSAAQVAVWDINNNTNLLPNIELVLCRVESGASIGFGLRFAFDLLDVTSIWRTFPSLPMVAFIGPEYHAAAEALAKLTTKQHMPHISFASLQSPTSAKQDMQQDSQLGTRDLRASVTRDALINARIEFMKIMGWKNFSILLDLQFRISGYTGQTVELLSEAALLNGLTVVSTKTFNSDVNRGHVDQMSYLKNIDARIIVLYVGYRARLHILLCEAYKLKLYGPKIVFISDVSPNRKTMASNDHNCTVEEVSTVAASVITFEERRLRDDDKVTVAGETAPRVLVRIKREQNLQEQRFRLKTTKEGDFNMDATTAYDSAFTVALAMHELMKPPISFDFTRFNKVDENFTLMMKEKMTAVNFEGLTGTVSFNPTTRDRNGQILAQKYTVDRGNESLVTFGTYDTKTKKFTLVPDARRKIFKDGIVPLDGKLAKSLVEIYSWKQLVFIWTFIILCVILALIFLAINVKNRNVRIIKMSSPKINNSIVVGGLLCYFSIFVYGLDGRTISHERIPIACNVMAFTLSIGFTLSYGAFFCKTWRIYKVFTAAKTLERITIKDLHLFLMISGFVVIDVIILVVWMFISPFNLEKAILSETVDVAGDAIVTNFYYRCKCEHQLAFTIALYVYKGLLLIFGIFLAWETRNVKVEVLNDSRCIGMAVYNTTVLSIVGVVATSAVRSTLQFEVSFIIVALCIGLGTTASLLLVFVPKVRLLLRKYPISFRSFSMLSSASKSVVSTENRDHRTSSVLSVPDAESKVKVVTGGPVVDTPNRVSKIKISEQIKEEDEVEFAGGYVNAAVEYDDLNFVSKETSKKPVEDVDVFVNMAYEKDFVLPVVLPSVETPNYSRCRLSSREAPVSDEKETPGNGEIGICLPMSDSPPTNMDPSHHGMDGVVHSASTDLSVIVYSGGQLNL